MNAQNANLQGLAGALAPAGALARAASSGATSAAAAAEFDALLKASAGRNEHAAGALDLLAAMSEAPAAGATGVAKIGGSALKERGARGENATGGAKIGDESVAAGGTGGAEIGDKKAAAAPRVAPEIAQKLAAAQGSQTPTGGAEIGDISALKERGARGENATGGAKIGDESVAAGGTGGAEIGDKFAAPFAAQKLAAPHPAKSSRYSAEELKLLKEQTDAFEGFMIKSMLDIAMPRQDGTIFGKDAGDEIYRDMYNDAISRALSGGLGLSALLYEHLTEQS